MAVAKVYDYLIIGAGMAGASLAYRLKDRGAIKVVEAESQAGYHSSGRSAAMFMETYGTATIRALTRASRSFFESPPQGFSDHGLLTDRGVLYIARVGQETLLAETLAQLRATGAEVRTVSAEEVVARVPCVRGEGLIGAIEEVDAKDVDVHALLQGFLKGAKQSGVEFSYGAAVRGAARDGDGWKVELASGETIAARAVVNAAGAWGQQVADLFGASRIGLQPKRRSAFTFKAGSDGAQAWQGIERWPAVVGIDESFYFKPDAGQLLGSPANADPVEPHDVVAEELDIAVGIDRITAATTLQIRRPSHTWAGLRSFVPDGDFVIGWDGKAAGFFWLVGQGGYGIQTSPGASLLAANLVLGQELDPSLKAEKLDASLVSPARFAA
ncbi:NAD(P)/FAD-dependent oxidoreductase [Parapusillimonas granuli]|uniref:FAD-binding oxidoreductase n=1 Tax=Parapusillimonas granuli TaxID=380911 RepID=A0A853G2M5_9BURK|nr:FAD-dependent oxidoreductase [Parapusillimonas granuli]MBB5214581.1 D-arginine dehydrogenase [Parapusillimonas granuli]MEB2398170.1 FAD-dependent oxidoreductase [Alcaligenaceae bacterium]NYT49011.1 FAD-binding oxidoreductase [Parapusillimonas granuli]